jgi:HK97 family phage portal protein
MSLVSWLFKKELYKLQQDIVRGNVGSDFYKALLTYIQNIPIYMGDNVEAYVKEGYLFNPTVYSIISFIAMKAAAIPWNVYEVKNEKALKLYKSASPDIEFYKKQIVKRKALTELPNHELNKLLISPNALQSWTELIEQTVGFKLVTGDAYLHCIGPENGNNAGKIQELWSLVSQITKIIAGDKMNPIKEYGMIGDESVHIPPEQIIHLKYWTPEYQSGAFLHGLSPIRAARRVVTRSNAGFDSMVASFQNAGIRGILTGDARTDDQGLTDEQAEAVQKKLEKMSGPRNTGKTPVTSAALRWQQMGMSPVDLAITASEINDLRSLCNVFHLASELFGDPDNKTFANAKEAGTAAYTNAIIPALNPIRDGLNKKIKERYSENIYLDYDTSMISELQDDLQKISVAVKDSWWITPNERRSLMSFDEDSDDPRMDQYWMPSGVVPIDIAEQGPAFTTPTPAIDQVALDQAAKMLGLKDYEDR